VLPWLGRLPAAAFTLAVAYGGFVLAEDVLGFSGITATVAAGLVLSGLAPSRASEAVRELWEQLWESLDYVANALLFLLIGLAIAPDLILDNLGAIALAVAVVIIARALAVVPLVSALERFAGIPRVGWRNQAVLIWGGLRGGVALALALALPESLPQRETFVAMPVSCPPATRTLLHEVDDQIEEASLDRPPEEVLQHRKQPRVDRLAQRLFGWLPEPAGEDPIQLAYAEASARRAAHGRGARAHRALAGH
jgi:CPA1 family monovalent cation:H+ antiporter